MKIIYIEASSIEELTELVNNYHPKYRVDGCLVVANNKFYQRMLLR